MRLIGVGLGGTSTLQAQAALEMLGFAPCYHITEVQKPPAQIAFCPEAAAGHPRRWNALSPGPHTAVAIPPGVPHRPPLRRRREGVRACDRN